MTARTAAVEQARAEFIPTDTELWDGTIVRDDDGAFAQVVGGRRDPLRVSKKNETELTNLLALRDGVTRLLDLESQSTVDGDEIRADTRRPAGRLRVIRAPLRADQPLHGDEDGRTPHPRSPASHEGRPLLVPRSSPWSCSTMRPRPPSPPRASSAASSHRARSRKGPRPPPRPSRSAWTGTGTPTSRPSPTCWERRSRMPANSWAPSSSTTPTRMVRLSPPPNTCPATCARSSTARTHRGRRRSGAVRTQRRRAAGGHPRNDRQRSDRGAHRCGVDRRRHAPGLLPIRAPRSVLPRREPSFPASGWSRATSTRSWPLRSTARTPAPRPRSPRRCSNSARSRFGWRSRWVTPSAG